MKAALAQTVRPLTICLSYFQPFLIVHFSIAFFVYLDSTQAVVYTIWLNNTMHFGFRGRQEHINVLWGDLELGQTADGTRYVAYTDRTT